MQNKLSIKYTTIVFAVLLILGEWYWFGWLKTLLFTGGACWFGGIEDIARKRGHPFTQWQKIGIRFAFVAAGFTLLLAHQLLSQNDAWVVAGLIILGIPVQIVAWLMPEHPDTTKEHEITGRANPA